MNEPVRFGKLYHGHHWQVVQNHLEYYQVPLLSDCSRCINWNEKLEDKMLS